MKHTQHHRRSIRLESYDYSLTGTYYVTICTHERTYLFGEIVGGALRHSSIGLIAQKCWEKIPVHFPGLQLDTHVIMPNHLHGILVITGNSEKGTPWRAPTFRRFGKPIAGSLATIINLFKASVTKRARQSTSLADRNGLPTLWQRNYYEHIIRSDRALSRIREYICENPAHWLRDPENPARTGNGSGDEILGIDSLEGY